MTEIQVNESFSEISSFELQFQILIAELTKLTILLFDFVYSIDNFLQLYPNGFDFGLNLLEFEVVLLTKIS